MRRWRELTGGKHTRDAQRRTLVACSGGADSVLLAIAIGQVTESCVIAHITHDLRSVSDTDQDRIFVHSLAAELGVEYLQDSVCVTSLQGNTEANARDARYAALGKLADISDCRYIATGHHADDQLETLLMHLMRGSGTRGMIGVHASQVTNSHTLVRPMLDLTRNEIETALNELGFGWQEDHTNRDLSLQRNRIRHELLPAMRKISPRISQHASEWGRDLASVQEMIEQQVELLIGRLLRRDSSWEWDRAMLRNQPSILLGSLPAHYIEQELGRVGLDQVTRRAIESWIRAVNSESTDPTTHRIGPIVSTVRANQVVFSPADHDVSQHGNN